MIIGICGKIGAGKDEVADYLVKKYNFKKIVMSDIIKEEMKKFNLKPTRENLQNFSKKMKSKFGNSIWAKKTIEWIRENNFENVVISGVRDIEEVKEFKKEKDFVLLGVFAPKKLRFERLIKRGSEKDPHNLKEAEEQEEREAEIFDLYNRCKDFADFLIENDSTVDELYQNIDTLIDKISKLYFH